MSKWPVIVPEFDLRVFCYQMLEKDPVAVTEAASAEITFARQNHRAQTGQSNFRKGTKARKYCDALQCLIRMLMNGEMPKDTPPAFLDAVRPLMKNLLKKWRVGNLHEHFTD